MKIAFLVSPEIKLLDLLLAAEPLQKLEKLGLHPRNLQVDFVTEAPSSSRVGVSAGTLFCIYQNLYFTDRIRYCSRGRYTNSQHKSMVKYDAPRSRCAFLHQPG